MRSSMAGLVAAALVVGAAASLTSQSAPAPNDAAFRPHLLRRLPQRPRKDGRSLARRTSISPTSPRTRRSGRRSARKVRSGEMPPSTVRESARCATPRRRSLRFSRRHSTAPRRRTPNPGRATAASPQPRRVQQRDPRSAGASTSTRRVAAGRRFRLRLRQHRRRAVDLARAARPLHVGGAQVSRLAVGDLTMKPVEEIYDAKRDPLKGSRNERLQRRSAVRFARRHRCETLLPARRRVRVQGSRARRAAGRRAGRGRPLSGARAGEGGPAHRRRHVTARDRSPNATRQPAVSRVPAGAAARPRSPGPSTCGSTARG